MRFYTDHYWLNGYWFGDETPAVVEPEPAPPADATAWDLCFVRSSLPILFRTSGLTVTYTPQGEASVTLKALVGDETCEEDEDQAGRRIKRRVCWATISTNADGRYGGVAAPQLRASMGVRGVEWGIAEVLPASYGLTRLKLTRNEVMQTGRPRRFLE